jgi:hypothetical protein
MKRGRGEPIEDMYSPSGQSSGAEAFVLERALADTAVVGGGAGRMGGWCMIDPVRGNVLVLKGIKEHHCTGQTPTQPFPAGIGTYSARYLLCNLSWTTEVPNFNTSVTI